MAGNIETYRGEFRRPAFRARATLRGPATVPPRVPAPAAAPPKSPCWPLVFSRWRRWARLHGAVNDGEHLRPPRSDGIHRAGLDQAFENALVQQARVDVIAELVDRSEAPEFGARFENSLHRVFSDVLDGAESESDGFADRREIEIARIHVGRKDRDAHAARFVDVFHDFLGVARFRGQQRGHELDRIMRFQIGGLIGEQRVGAGVRFIETVSGEFRHQIENLFGFFRGNFSRGASGQEFFALRRHFVAVLFAHRAAQDVRFAQAKSRPGDWRSA